MRSSAYEQMRKRLLKTAKEKKVPLMVNFELTARCNFDCKMCYVHTQDNASLLHKELSTEQWKQIFDEAYRCEMLYASLSGGECLLRKDFKELYLHLWNKHVMVSVLTNGALLTDEYVEFFKTYKPEKIQISVYGSDDKHYLAVTGHKGFDKVFSAIDALEAAGIDVRVASTPSKYMTKDFIRILQICKEKKYFVENSPIALIPNRDNPEKNDYFLSEDEIVSLSIEQAELKRKLEPVLDTPEPCGDMCDAPVKGMPCNAGNSSCVVSSDGKMYLCSAVMEGGADVIELGFEESWRRTVQTASEIVQGVECVGCPYDTVCPVCPATRLKDLRSGRCNPQTCQLTRRLVAAGVKKLPEKM